MIPADRVTGWWNVASIGMIIAAPASMIFPGSPALVRA